MQDLESSVNQKREAKLDADSTRFNNSLQELKDLCSQLHCAADYCETSFLNAENGQKKLVMENTKEYLCRAVVTVVDHLGSVSANLDYQLSNNSVVSETEFLISGLDQRLIAWQQYSHKLGLTKMCWNTNFPRYHSRYIFPPLPNKERPKEIARKSGSLMENKTCSKHEFETEEEVPLFLYTCNHRPSSSKDSINNKDETVLPVRDGLSILPKARNPSFNFEGPRKFKGNLFRWRLVQNPIIRRSKRAA